MPIRSYKEFIVWQKSIDLVDCVYKFSSQFPKSEIYGLSSQMRRAAVAIPSNIAEGYRRQHRLEFIQFLSIVNASAAELETQIIIAQRQYPNILYADTLKLLDEILKMLHAMIGKLKNNSVPSIR